MELWIQARPPFSKYEVSSEGRIRNRSGYELRGSTGTGYLRVGIISDSGRFATVLVHRLVAEAFHGPPRPKDVGHHINGNTRDNRCSNLAWVSRSENMKVRAPPKKTKARAVLQKDVGGVVVNRWERLKDVPFNKSLVWKACRGLVPKAYGYFWSYEDSPSPGEVWASIMFDGHPLEVSDQGRVKLATGRITHGHKSKTGYRVVRPFKGKSIVVHRLVALAFLSTSNNVDELTVNHKNFNKSDNMVTNLEWVTQGENNIHSQQVRGDSRVFRRAILQHLPGGETRAFASLAEASRELGISRGNICMVCQGDRPTAGGFRWSYAP